LGDPSVGRPNLGNSARVEIYRLMQFTLRDAIEARYDGDAADDVFHEAGMIAGREFYAHFLSDAKTFGGFIKLARDAMREYGMGILKIEEADDDARKIVMTVGEDLDCSGLPETGSQVCKFDEGFISGMMESFTGKRYNVREVDCWCTGDRTCRFAVEIAD
jgi:predicted hydrocarbon binding protein